MGNRVSSARPNSVSIAERSITSLADDSSCNVNPALTLIKVAGIIPKKKRGRKGVSVFLAGGVVLLTKESAKAKITIRDVQQGRSQVDKPVRK